MRIARERVPRYCLVAVVASAVIAGAAAPAAAQRSLGLDISAWQGNISQTTWNNIRNVENRQFVFLRSSRGGTTGYYNQSNPDNDNPPGQNTLSQRYDDPYFVQNINRSTAAGIYAGPYHFSRPDIVASTLNSNGIANTGADEANHFLQMAGPWMRPGYLLPVHDLEAGQSQRTSAQLSAFAVDFSNRIYQVMGIRPIVYSSQSYANYVDSTVPPVYPNLWIARWPQGSGNQFTGNVQTDNPPPSPSTANVYGEWNPNHTVANPYPDGHPWKFWQYSSGERLQSFNNGGSNLDGDVANGGIEFLKDHLVPALWMNDNSGQWTTLANWNSGQTPVAPVTGPGQVTPVGTQTLPTPRLPGAAGSGVTSGQHDTVILDRSTANITVTHSSGTHNIRKLLVRETLDITGGSLTINYNPSSWDSPHTPIQPVSAQFSGAVSLGGSGALSVHTLQVDATRTFTLGGGTLTFNKINLMPHATTPATIAVSGDVVINPLANATAIIANGSGAGSSGRIDLTGGTRTFNVGNGSADVDFDVNVSITNGGLTKSGTGTMRLGGANTFNGPVTVNGGVLRYGNAGGLSSSSVITVDNSSTLDMNGISDTVAALASNSGQTTGAVMQGAASFTVAAGSGSNTFHGTITGTGTFTKNGAATQILAGNNSLGAVNVNAGSLILNGTNTTGPVTVNGGTLGGTGSVSGAVTVHSGGHMSPGASIESLDVGALTLHAGSVLDFEVGGIAGLTDRINVAGLLTLSGGTVNIIDAGNLDFAEYTLIDYGTLSGSVTNLGTPTGPAGFSYSLIDTGSVIKLSVSPVGVSGDYNNDGSVDAGDYIVWAKNKNTSNPLQNDNGIGGVVGAQHYDLWLNNFGHTQSGAGSGDGGAVPEPASAVLLILGTVGFLAARRGR